LAEHLADDTRALAVWGIGADAHVVHGEEDAPVNRLKAIARVGQGAGHDHAHSVVEIRFSHLFVDVYRRDTSDIQNCLQKGLLPCGERLLQPARNSTSGSKKRATARWVATQRIIPQNRPENEAGTGLLGSRSPSCNRGK